ncbi:hypothetical protein TNIN_284571 [Trichonephila inaurata madagascariensis]|uniref:Uncharacterized protein n=1 Tax=Trichonephila inaurata madagascariensis TaxID=2747483 RepID=A0A8X7CLS0_9ARAC|nr:hypothetical protein TNIN_284571 [Trichonephila inaurata madagascariensis]
MAKALDEDFPALSNPSAPDEETAPSMETDSIPTDEDNDATCAKLVDLRDFQLLHEARLRHHREIQEMIVTGVMRGNKTAYDNLIQEIEKTSASLEDVAGELALIGTCPKINCQIHPISNEDQKTNLKATTQLENQLEKLNVSKTNNDKLKNSDRSDGFTTPTKAAKKQKVLQNYSIGANAPVNTANKFQPLASTATLTQDNVAMPVAPHPPQIPEKFQPDNAGNQQTLSKIQFKTVRGVPQNFCIFGRGTSCYHQFPYGKR